MQNSQGKLQGKVALITGGSSGIGLATAIRFVNEGAYVFITGRRQAELDKAVQKIGSNVKAIQGDVANLADIEHIYQVIKQEKGHIDILFANAGGGTTSPLGQITPEHYDSIFNTNVKGLLFSVQSALPLLKDGSSIILNASIVSQKGFENFSVYNASKAAVRSFARTWTNDLKSRKIRVNALSPGVTETDFFKAGGMSEEQSTQTIQAIASNVPLGRAGTADDLAKAAVFLASEDSSFITGIELFVDGGMIQV